MEAAEIKSESNASSEEHELSPGPADKTKDKEFNEQYIEIN
jgi:hypothetical protein